MSEVTTDIQDGVIIVTLNRPEAKNAMNKAAAEGIRAAMQQLDDDNSLNAGIITGAGGTFCSGMDLKGFLKGESPMVDGYGFGGICQKGPEKPLIAAIEGYALAGGMELAIACDLRVANDKAQFGIPEVKRSLVAAAGGLLHLSSIVGKGVAMELALTGDFIDAQRAYEVGFVNRRDYRHVNARVLRHIRTESVPWFREFRPHASASSAATFFVWCRPHTIRYALPSGPA